jgi:hypothetical protein
MRRGYISANYTRRGKMHGAAALALQLKSASTYVAFTPPLVAPIPTFPRVAREGENSAERLRVREEGKCAARYDVREFVPAKNRIV